MVFQPMSYTEWRTVRIYHCTLGTLSIGSNSSLVIDGCMGRENHRTVGGQHQSARHTHNLTRSNSHRNSNDLNDAHCSFQSKCQKWGANRGNKLLNSGGTARCDASILARVVFGGTALYSSSFDLFLAGTTHYDWWQVSVSCRSHCRKWVSYRTLYVCQGCVIIRQQ